MRRMTTALIWLTLAACVSIGMFVLKYEVQEQEARLASINAQIKADQKAMHVLKAEWSHLNDPERIRKLAEKHIGLKPIKSDRITTIAALPFRDQQVDLASATSPTRTVNKPVLPRQNVSFTTASRAHP